MLCPGDGSSHAGDPRGAQRPGRAPRARCRDRRARALRLPRVSHGRRRVPGRGQQDHDLSALARPGGARHRGRRSDACPPPSEPAPRHRTTRARSRRGVLAAIHLRSKDRGPRLGPAPRGALSTRGRGDHRRCGGRAPRRVEIDGHSRHRTERAAAANRRAVGPRSRPCDRRLAAVRWKAGSRLADPRGADGPRGRPCRRAQVGASRARSRVVASAANAAASRTGAPGRWTRWTGRGDGS
jgi:hypothetical protein